jgi:hypothetical protein
VSSAGLAAQAHVAGRREGAAGAGRSHKPVEDYLKK